MDQLLTSLRNLFSASWDVLLAILALLVPWTPLIAWIAFWLFAVNWEKLYKVMVKGGWVGVVLIGLVMILVWGVVAPPAGGNHQLFGLSVTNFVGKAVYVTTLLVIMSLCGSVQLTGACGSLARFPAPKADDCHASHVHPDDHGHEHDSHLHASPPQNSGNGADNHSHGHGH